MNVKKIQMVVLTHALTLHQATPVLVDLAIVWEVIDTDVMVSCLYRQFSGLNPQCMREGYVSCSVCLCVCVCYQASCYTLCLCIESKAVLNEFLVGF